MHREKQRERERVLHKDMSSKPLLGRSSAHEEQQPIKFFSLSHLLSLFRRRHIKDGGPAECLPALLDVPTSKRPLLFILKLALCSVVFDFTDPWKEPEEKEMKAQTLLELTEYLSDWRMLKKLDKAAIEATYCMVSANLFRSLPASKVGCVEEEQPQLDPSWPHLQLVYDFLLVFLNHPKIIKYADDNFLLRLLDLFESEDPRERDYLKKGLHRIYGMSQCHRVFLRKAFRRIFHRVMLGTEKHNGIGELLDVMHSIIHGFVLPLKEEHKLFLLETLIPLHKTKWLWMYHNSICACTVVFVEKESKLAGPVIRGLLDYWPVTNSLNEVLMLEELGYVLEATQLGDFQSCMVPLFQHINQSLVSSHMEVVEGALKLWSNEHIASMIAQNRCVILPYIVGAIERLSDGHENQTVRGLAQNVRKMFEDLDKERYQECLKAHRDQVKVEAAFAANTPTAKLVLAK